MASPGPEARIAAAAFRLLAKEPWDGLTLASVARAAKLPWDVMLTLAPSRTALVGLMLRRAAADTAKQYQPDSVSRSARERLFDAIMTWFEAQNGRKDALRSLYDGLRREPLMLLLLRADFIASAEWLLALAEVDAGPAAPVRIACIGGLVVHAFPVWLSDEADMGKTMARVDRDLRRVERFFGAPQQPRARSRRKPRSR